MLEGVRVLDLTQYLSGPACTLLMAGLGADVIKVEPGPGGDAARVLPVVKGDHSSYFVQQNRGKRSVCVDMNQSAGHDLIASLAVECDVLVENYGYGVLEKRGLGPDALRSLNPGLIYASISTFGRTGSKAHLPGFDLIAQAYAGSAALTGERDGAPLASAAPMGDVGAGMMAFGAISAALYGRVSTGEGQFIDISMVESIFNMHPFAIQGPSQTDGKARLKRTGRHFGAVPPAGTFMGPDGWLAIHVLAGQWSRLCDAAESIGLAGIEKFQTPKGRADNRIELLEVLEAWMQTYPSNEVLLAHLEAHRVPAASVIDPADAHLDDWYVERGAVTHVDDPHLGSITVPGFPIHASGVPRRNVEPLAPELGEHNEAVLNELLGFTPSHVANLTASGVITSNLT
jgi:crotonobetainyl-CoA:carnitine CoA-transferase CaiB-like acyl-CoA transferase